MKRLCRAAFASLALATIALCAGCTKGEILDYAMRGAPRPARQSGERVGPYRILAGDFHTHVLPPDAPWHVTRELPQTASIAEAEGLDFVVLTPHVPARFFLSPAERRWVLETQAILRSEIAALKTDVLFVPGMEYTDHEWGHLGLAFADVAEILDELPLAAALAKPESFFERWLAHGGLATINHPVARAIPRAGIADLRADISWRALRLAPSRAPQVVAPEIAWLTEHAPAIETYNLAIAHLRDQFFLSDEDFTFREATHLVDREARRTERIIAPVGGSDSHGGWLRATTWVLATERTPEAIRDAIVAGRTCVRGPETCTFEARAPGTAEWRTVGGSIATEHGTSIEARVRGGAATYYVNNEIVVSADEGATVHVPVPDRCALVRVAVGRSMSAPIYVGCPWANPPSR